jgi:hypothetical protein
MVSSFFTTIVLAVGLKKTVGFALYWPPAHANVAFDWRPWKCCMQLAAMQMLHATGGQLHINCNGVATSCMQKKPAWPPVACNMNKSTVICATGGHTGTICIGLAAIQVQFACDLRPLRYIWHATDWRQLGYKTSSRQEVYKSLSLHHNYIF